MPADTVQEQLVKYLTDVHGQEESAIAQLKTGVAEAGDPQLAEVFRSHLTETEEQERLIRERLEAHDASPSSVKDVAFKAGAAMTGTLAKSAPDTTGKLAIQAYAFEHLEIASYRMLTVVAERAGDHETVQLAQRILTQERAAAQKIDGLLETIAAGDLERMDVAA